MRLKLLIVLAGIAVIAAAAAVAVAVYFAFIKDWETYEVELTDYKPPSSSDDDQLADDRLEDKKTTFDEALVDRRPIGEGGAWLLNASAAVIRLDVPLIKTDQDKNLQILYPSYADTFQHSSHAVPVLPSLNLLDGKTKQFDDGLYAALDQAYFQGLPGKLPSHVKLIQRLAEHAGKNSPAAPYLAAGLQLAGVDIDVADHQAKEHFLVAFRNNEAASKPIGFYTWNEELEKLFRFMRFFQREFSPDQKEELAIVQALVAALIDDKQLAADYQQAIDFYSRLTNPSQGLSLADFSTAQLDSAAVKQAAEKLHRSHKTVAVFPASTSKEVVLFEELFPLGVPPDVDLMKELVRRIRSGEVNLKPKADSGWYDYQVYALETLLLPEKGAEKDKLLMTRAYKKRMVEAFKALITKRRETHVRELGTGLAKTSAGPKPPDQFGPPLRIEPCPTYYLRTARAYSFLANFLEAAVGKDKLAELHGLKKNGTRTPDLYKELVDIRDLFYGLYLVSAEDIGLKPDLASDEPVDQDHCYQVATSWLPKASTDPDLAVDTRVGVPIFIDQNRGVTRLWVTLGVRLAQLEAGYARPPSIKPAKGGGAWREAEPHELKNSYFLIPVDEFADVELKGNQVLSREDLRAVCDREKTKEAIVQALRERR